MSWPRAALFLIGALAASGQQNWTQQTPATAPSPRYGAVMAYDTLHQQIVLFGGEAIVGRFTETVNDTWLWNGATGTWTQASPVHSPPARDYAQGAYDEARQQLVLFGGAGSTGGNLADTWVWDGTDWTQKSPAAQPTARNESAMVYDEIRQQVVLFGGGGTDLFGDTWVWDGTTWTQKHPVNSPVALNAPTMAYDIARQQTVLYGGSNSDFGTGTYGMLGDTWVWDGTTWTKKTPATSPPLGGFGALAYDSALQEVVLFPGFDVNGNDIQGTWVWNGVTWAALTVATNPPPRNSGSNQMAYDASQQQLVLFGGFSNSTGSLGDTWTLGASASPVAVTITVPAGVQFSFNGTTYTGTQIINIAPGGYTLSTNSPQATAVGTQAVFLSWSDTGAQSHTVTVASSAVNVTGVFKTQYLLTASANPPAGGTVSVDTPGPYYDSSTVVNVSETPATGYVFTGWSSVCGAVSSPCAVTMNAPVSIAANFAAQQYTVNINVPPGILYSFNGVASTGAQSFSVPSGSYALAVITPQPSGTGAQAVFLSWSDGGAASHSVVVAGAPITVTGSFKTQFLLTTSAVPSGFGTVSPASGYVDQGTTVTVTATPASGDGFVNWGGACSGSGACSFVMNAPASVGATFKDLHEAVSIIVPSGIQFTLSGFPFTGSQTLSLLPGSYLLSTPAAQSTGAGTQAVFVSWSDGGALSHNIMVASAPVSVTGTFKTQYQLTIADSPASGGGTSVASGTFYDASTAVVLEAVANSGYTFQYWSGACSGSNAFCLVIMTAPESVTANFSVPLNWVELFPPTNPAPRDSHSIAYDSLRNEMVMFGGQTLGGSIALSETWVWDGSNWLQRNPQNSPTGRVSAAMTYDARNHQVVLFSGLEGGFSGTDTWVWDGTNWTQKTASVNAPGPSDRYSAAMVFDQTNNQVVLFGGSHAVEFGTPTPNDTWVWDGNAWSQKNPQTSPSARSLHAMAYDQARHRVVMFGGQDSANNLVSDTWEWDGSNWTLQSPSISPPARYGAVMAFDQSIQQMVLFGGRGLNGRLNDTWVWNGTNWSQVFPATNPPVREFSAGDYDSLHQQMFMFGGQETFDTDLGDTWIYLPPSVNILSEGTSAAKDAQGNILVTVTLKNAGNIPLADVFVLTAKLGTTSATRFTTPQLVANVAPGATVSFTAQFPPQTGNGLTGPAISFGGSYSAGAVVGAQWTVNVRQSILP